MTYEHNIQHTNRKPNSSTDQLKNHWDLKSTTHLIYKVI